MDPYVKYVKLFVEGRYNNKTVEIKVGLDIEDAVLHGITLLMPLTALRSPRHRKGLQQAGFDREVADEMLALNAWHTLHSNGKIEHPSRGVSLDISTAWKMYQLIKVTKNPWGEEDEPKKLRLELMPEEERQRRKNMPKTKANIGEWVKRMEPEPEEDQ